MEHAGSPVRFDKWYHARPWIFSQLSPNSPILGGMEESRQKQKITVKEKSFVSTVIYISKIIMYTSFVFSGHDNLAERFLLLGTNTRSAFSIADNKRIYIRATLSWLPSRQKKCVFVSIRSPPYQNLLTKRTLERGRGAEGAAASRVEAGGQAKYFDSSRKLPWISVSRSRADHNARSLFIVHVSLEVDSSLSSTVWRKPTLLFYLLS